MIGWIWFVRTFPAIQEKMDDMPRMAGKVSQPRISTILNNVFRLSTSAQAPDSEVAKYMYTWIPNRISQKQRKIMGIFKRSHSASAKAITPSVRMNDDT